MVLEATEAPRIAEVAERSPPDWDALTVDPPGGQVLQGSGWAEHCRTQGWRPHFLRFSDGRAALVLTRRKPPLPGLLAYAPRGPISAGDEPVRVAGRAVALADWSRRAGAMVFAVDPVLDEDAAYETVLSEHGFHPIEEIEPSRHRLLLPFPAGTDEEQLFATCRHGTRQAIRAAERRGTVVREDREGTWLARFGQLLEATAQRRGFYFSSRDGFLAWWRRVLAQGRARFLVAECDGVFLGGLIAYLQDRRDVVAFAADRVDLRREAPGAMHLLWWTAIRGALAAGGEAIDLGGADIHGHRGIPGPGDPTRGLYEFKTGFGARWVQSESAHEIVLRPRLYGVATGLRALRRALTGAWRP